MRQEENADARKKIETDQHYSVVILSKCKGDKVLSHPPRVLFLTTEVQFEIIQNVVAPSFPGDTLKLSIITVNLNNGCGLRDTLQSVAGQFGFSDFEHIVIDGGSTDSSLDVISDFRAHLAKLVSEPDSGIYHAMNKGISLAEGEYLLFLNSGDVLTPNVFERIDFASFQEDLIYGDLDFQDQNRIRHKEMPPPEAIVPAFFLFNSLPHPATFIRRSLFQDFGLYDDSLKIAADAKFFFRVVNSGKASLRRIPVTVSIFMTDGISSDPAFASVRRNECRSYLIPAFGDEVFKHEDLLIERTALLKEQLRLVARYRTLVRDATFAAAMENADVAEDVLRMTDFMLAIRKMAIGRPMIRFVSRMLRRRELKSLARTEHRTGKGLG